MDYYPGKMWKKVLLTVKRYLYNQTSFKQTYIKQPSPIKMPCMQL